MKHKRTDEMEISVRYTTKNRIGAFIGRAPHQTPRTLATCAAYDHPKMLEFVRHWRAVAVLNYISFSLSYELSHVLRLENSSTLINQRSVTSDAVRPIDSPGDVSLIGGAGSESGHRQDSRVSKPRQDAGSTPASRS